MSRKRILIIAVAIVILIYCLPPVMFCKDGIVLGQKTADFSEPYVHASQPEGGFPFGKIHYTTDFDNFYVINLKFWEKLKISQAIYLQNNEEIVEHQIAPFLYSVKQNQKYSHLNTYEVKRGNDCWYFDYWSVTQ